MYSSSDCFASQSVSMLRPITDFDSLISLSGLKRGIWASTRSAAERVAPLAGLHLGGAEADQPAAGAQQREALLEAAAADARRGPGRAAASRPRSGAPRRRSPGCGSRSGDPRRSRGSRRASRGRGGAVDLRADELGDLGGGDAHPAGRGLDQHALAGVQRAVADQRRVGGRVGHRQRRALAVAPAVGQRHQRAGRGRRPAPRSRRSGSRPSRAGRPRSPSTPAPSDSTSPATS